MISAVQTRVCLILFFWGGAGCGIGSVQTLSYLWSKCIVMVHCEDFLVNITVQIRAFRVKVPKISKEPLEISVKNRKIV